MSAQGEGSGASGDEGGKGKKFNLNKFTEDLRKCLEQQKARSAARDKKLEAGEPLTISEEEEELVEAEGKESSTVAARIPDYSDREAMKALELIAMQREREGTRRPLEEMLASAERELVDQPGESAFTPPDLPVENPEDESAGPRPQDLPMEEAMATEPAPSQHHLQRMHTSTQHSLADIGPVPAPRFTMLDVTAPLPVDDDWPAAAQALFTQEQLFFLVQMAEAGVDPKLDFSPLQVFITMFYESCKRKVSTYFLYLCRVVSILLSSDRISVVIKFPLQKSVSCFSKN